jgi:hypothetical protein
MRLSCRIILALLAIFLTLLVIAPRFFFAQTLRQPATGLTAPWADAVRAFARKIANAVDGGNSILLDFANLSTLSSTDAEAVERQLQAALGSAGFRMAGAQGGEQTDARVHVTLSEGAEGYLWVAEIHTAATDRVVMTNVRALDRAAERAAPVPVLRQTPVLSQAEPILDFAVVPVPGAGNEGAQVLLLLSPEQVTVFTQREGQWMKADAAPIASRASAGAWPRDLRGEIVAGGALSDAGALKVYLPDEFCTGSMQAKLSLRCGSGADTAWPLGGNIKAALAPGRNYFNTTGPDASAARAPWYSMATNSDAQHPAKIVAPVSESAGLFAGSEQTQVTTLGRWGDEFSSIAGCGDSWNVIAAGNGDWTQPDSLQDYEVTERQAAMAGQPLEFSGPILALWPSDDGKSVRAVSRNLNTGMYEASLISISCGD